MTLSKYTRLAKRGAHSSSDDAFTWKGPSEFDPIRQETVFASTRGAFADLLPPANANAPKRGFNFPLAVWMRDYFDKYFDTHMDRDYLRAQGILNWDYVQLLREQHRLGKNDNSYPLFSLIMFDVWYRKYILGINSEVNL